MFTALAFTACLVCADEKRPLVTDHTGLKWILPFKEAKNRAEKENRLLFLKPIAFGSTAEGNW